MPIKYTLYAVSSSNQHLRKSHPKGRTPKNPPNPIIRQHHDISEDRNSPVRSCSAFPLQRPSNAWNPTALVTVRDLATTGEVRKTLTPVAARAQTLLLVLLVDGTADGRAAVRAAMEKADVAAMAMALGTWQPAGD